MTAPTIPGVPADLIADVIHSILASAAPPRVRDEWLAAVRPEALTRAGVPVHFTASALPINPDGTAVCLVLHRRIGKWVQPGGHFEPGDPSVSGAAEREMAEETGLIGAVGAGPLHLSRHPAPCGSGDWHLDIQMIAVVDRVRPSVSDESLGAAWFAVDCLPDELAPGVSRLVARAVSRVSGSGSRGSRTPPA